MGMLFSSLGLLPCSDVVEVSASDLITGYVGQAGKKTFDVLTKARGKVLFIDEAYQLNPNKGGEYMQQAVDELVKALTSDEFKGRLVVILAGYEKDIDDMIKCNQGLKSRFSEKILFQDFSLTATEELLCLKLNEMGLELTSKTKAALPNILLDLINAPKFANGRDIDTLSKRIYRKFAKMAKDSSSTYVDIDLISSTLNEFLLTKVETTESSLSNQRASSKPSYAKMSDKIFEPVMLTTTKQEMIKVDRDKDKEIEKDAVNSDPTSNASKWQPLQMLLDQKGWNNELDVAQLSALDLNHPTMESLVKELSSLSDLSIDAAMNLLIEWKTLQEGVQKKMKEQQLELLLAKEQKRKARVPIWRCAVCGRSDKPYITCHVAPYIVRYDEIDI